MEIFTIDKQNSKTHYVIKLIGMRIKIKKPKSYELESGERQTAISIDNIRRDHTCRYNMVIDKIKQYLDVTKTLNGIDVFCGTGYGSYLVTEKLPNCKILSIDGSNDAIELGKKYYSNENITYEQRFFPFKLEQNKYDFAISLESIEHIKPDIKFLDTILSSLKKDGLIILSTPNEKLWSLKINKHKFHFRHYIPSEFVEVLKSKNLDILEIWGQDTYTFDENGKKTGNLSEDEMELRKDYEGQFVVYVCKKK